MVKTSQEARRSKKAKLYESLRGGCVNVINRNVRTLGAMLHDPSISVQQFSHTLRTATIPVSLKPLSHIFDGGDVSAATFLQKWSIVLQTAATSDLAELLLNLVGHESLILKSEFKKHKVMLKMLLEAIQDWKVLRSGLQTAVEICSRDVTSFLLGRLHKLVPGLAVKLERQLVQLLQEPSLAMQDQLDQEEDARLAALEEDAHSDDDDFIVDDEDETAEQDGDYIPESESENDSDQQSDDEPLLQ